MKGVVGLVLVAGLLCCSPWGPGPLSAQIGQEEVTSLSFQGNRSFSSQALANAIITRETECRSGVLVLFCLAGSEFSLEPYYLLEREFRRDLARVQLFYYQMGYRETVVDTLVERPSEGEVSITFQIQEGEPVRVVELGFSGLEELPDSSILENLPMEIGDPLSLLTFQATEDTLVDRLRNQGYAHAEVLKYYDLPSTAPHEVLIGFDLYPGPLVRFGPLTVEGNRAVDEGTIRRMLPFQEGDVYGRELRFAGQRNLYNLEIFSFINMIPDLTHQPDSIVPFQIQVGEGQLRRVRAGAGLSTADCLNAEARWASRNFFGGARRLQLTGRVSNVLASELQSTLCRDAGTGDYSRLNWLASVDFTQPWLFSPRNSFSAGAFWERQSLPEIFVRESQGLNLAVTRTLAVSTLLSFSFRPQFTSLTAAEIFFCSNYLICTPEDIKVLQGNNRLSPVGLSLSRDRRNQVLSPTRGYSAQLDLEHAAEWSGSDYKYSRVLAEGTWYTQGDSRWVLATRLRGGWVRPGGFSGLGEATSSDDVIHPNKRLYAGGANSVRGYAQNRLGPLVLQAEVEDLLREGTVSGAPAPPLCTPEGIQDRSCDAQGLGDGGFSPRPTGGTAMVEGGLEVRFPLSGQTWEGATFVDFGQVWAEETDLGWGDVELTPGFGVRYFSPIGPIRVDLAYRARGGERLQVVTTNIRPFDPDQGDDEGDKLAGLDWVEAEDLSLLGPRVLFGDYDPWSLRRFQLHLSIGQAF